MVILICGSLVTIQVTVDGWSYETALGFTQEKYLLIKFTGKLETLYLHGIVKHYNASPSSQISL